MSHYARITFFDPVTAAGRRAAVEAHIAVRQGAVLRPSMTNELMSAQLLAAPIQKNVITTFVDNSVITGELAETWKEKARVQQQKFASHAEAKEGGVKAMLDLSASLYSGRGGFQKDLDTAHNWYKKVHHAEHPLGTFMIGHALLLGIEAKKDVGLAMYYILDAASKGVNNAACSL